MANIISFYELPPAGIWIKIQDDAESERLIWLKNRNSVKDLTAQLHKKMEVPCDALVSP